GVSKAVRPHASATPAASAFGDYQMAEADTRIAQTGQGLVPVVGRLREKDLYKRRFVWELLRVGLARPYDFFDPAPDPPKARPPDVDGIRKVLEKRRPR